MEAVQMGPEKERRLRQLLRRVSDSELSSFYRERFNASGYSLPREDEPVDVTAIPHTTWEDFAARPLSERLYEVRELLVKPVYPRAEDMKAMLIARTRKDIALEQFGSKGERPLVFFDSMQECVEKSFWYYARNILPLAGDENANLAARAASRYGIDALLADERSLSSIVPELVSTAAFSTLKHVSVIGTGIPADVSHLLGRVSWRVVLALPETGTIAISCPDAEGESPLFHPDPAAVVEIENGEVVLTRLIDLPTPIIRYRTGILAREEAPVCSCALSSSFSTMRRVPAFS